MLSELINQDIRMATRKTSTADHTATKAAAPRAVARRSAAAIPNAPAKAPRSTVANESIAFPKPKQKLVRDTFTFPKTEYAVLRELKQRAAQLARPAKKSEILRAGLGVLNAMSDTAFVAALAAVPSLKSKSPKDVKSAAGKAAAKSVSKPVRK